MKVSIYKQMNGHFRVREVYGLSQETYRALKKKGLPVYKSMSGSLNLRASTYTKEQAMKIKKFIESREG